MTTLEGAALSVLLLAGVLVLLWLVSVLVAVVVVYRAESQNKARGGCGALMTEDRYR